MYLDPGCLRDDAAGAEAEGDRTINPFDLLPSDAPKGPSRAGF